MSQTVMSFNLLSLAFHISQEKQGEEHPLMPSLPCLPLSCLSMFNHASNCM